MELFGRIIELYVGLKGNEALKIANLNIEFDINKGADTKDNTATAKIKIYNCNQSTTNELLTIGKHIILKAGYKGISTERDPLVLFNGFISKAFIEKQKPDSIINIEAVDGMENIMTTSASYSFIENTDVYTVVKKLTDLLGFPVKGLSPNEDPPVYSKLKSSFFDQGYSYFGMAKDCLTEVLKRVGLTYSIQNETLYIHFPNTQIQNIGFVIKSSTGLLSVPQQLFEDNNSSQNETDKPKWKFKCLLYPQLIPNSVCRVESSTLNGEVLVAEAHFSGSNMRNDFTVEVTVIQI